MSRWGLIWILLACGAGSGFVSAFDIVKDRSSVYVITWKPGSIDMTVKLPTSATFLDGSNHQSSLVAAMEAWNAQLGLVQFSAKLEQPGDYQIWNGVSEVVLDDTMDGFEFGDDVLAVAVSFNDGNRRTEGDVIFNSRWNWNSFRGDLRPGLQDIRRVAIHELGHVLGLLHPDQASPAQQVEALMNSVVSATDSLHADDITGAQFLYGTPGFRPRNDDFDASDFIAFTGAPVSVFGSTIGATRESGEPRPLDQDQGAYSIWWTWTAPIAGTTKVTTLGSNFDTSLAVYTETEVGGLTLVGANDDVKSGVVRSSTLDVAVEEGMVYYAVVDGWDGAFGMVQLNLVGPLPNGFPAITLHPVKKVGGVGHTASFSVEAVGKAPLQFQWQRQSIGQGWEDLSNGNGVDGATTAALELSNLQLSQTGELYRARVFNDLGPVFSEPAELFVSLNVPRIESEPSDKFLQQGDELDLLVGVSSTSGNLRYKWFRDGSDFPAFAGPSYQQPAVQPEHAGTYQLKVSTDLATVWSREIVVTVDTGPGAVSVSVGGDNQLFLRADGLLMGHGDQTFKGVPTGLRPATNFPQRNMSDITSMTTSGGNIFGIKTDNSLWGYGRNRAGEVRPREVFYESVDEPLKIATDIGFVAAGPDNAVYINLKGELWVSGEGFSFGLQKLADSAQSAVIQSGNNIVYLNAEGEVHYVTPFDRSDASAPLATDVTAIHSKGGRTLFLHREGTVSVLGLYLTDPVVPIAGLSDVVEMEGSWRTYMFLKSDGSLWAMGENSVGQFGTGTTEDSELPIQIQTDVFDMAGDGTITRFLRTDGSVWAMGEGRLGDGREDGSLIPVWIADGPLVAPDAPQGLVASDARPLDVVRLHWDANLGTTYYEIWRSETDDLTEATLRQDRWKGTVWHDGGTQIDEHFLYWVRAVNPEGKSAFSRADEGWREGQVPQFLGQPESRPMLEGALLRTSVVVEANPVASLQWQVKLIGEDLWSDVVDEAGVEGSQDNEIVVQNVPGIWDGAVLRCVARNEAGETFSNEIELRVYASVAVATGDAYDDSTLFVREDGTLWGMGRNQNGQLGDGSTELHSSPVILGTDVVEVAVAGSHSLFLKKDGSLWGSGKNAWGQLSGTPGEDELSPVKLADDVVSFDAAGDYSTFVNRNGELYFWGRQFGTETPQIVEEAVLSTKVRTVKADRSAMLYVKEDGGLWGWGIPSSGKFGSNVSSEGVLAEPIRLAEHVKRADLGTKSIMYETDDGRLLGLGDNSRDIIGDAFPSYLGSPVEVNQGVRDFTFGESFSLVIEADGELWRRGYFNTGLVIFTPGPRNYPARLVMEGAVRASAGNNIGLVITEAGALRGMGDNEYHQLSSGDEEVIGATVLIHGGPHVPLTGFGSLAGEKLTENQGIRLDWMRHPAVKSYEVWRGRGPEITEAELLVSSWEGVNYWDYPVLGGDYYYWVVARTFGGASVQAPAQTLALPIRKALLLDRGQVAVAAAGEMFVVAIGADEGWSVTVPDWIVAGQARGEGDGDVSFTVGLNDSILERSGQILINNRVIAITQSGQPVSVPSFSQQPRSAVAQAGEQVRFGISTNGYPKPVLQWFFNGEVLVGQEGTELVIESTTEETAGAYRVVATNSEGSAQSSIAQLFLAPSESTSGATHQMKDTENRAGTPVTILNQWGGASGAETLRWTVLLPEGWQLVSQTVTASASSPASGQMDLLEWVWDAGHSSSFDFEYVLQNESRRASADEVIALIERVDAGETQWSLVQPDPLVLNLISGFHSADTDGDNRLGLSELLRVIELYNTRFGTMRTGRYLIGSESTDGFDPDSTSSEAVVLERNHTADTDQDGRLSLPELLRVIELYNTRSGTTRTGAYRAASQTADGFEPEAESL